MTRVQKNLKFIFLLSCGCNRSSALDILAVRSVDSNELQCICVFHDFPAKINQIKNQRWHAWIKTCFESSNVSLAYHCMWLSACYISREVSDIESLAENILQYIFSTLWPMIDTIITMNDDTSEDTEAMPTITRTSCFQSLHRIKSKVLYLDPTFFRYQICALSLFHRKVNVQNSKH